MLFYLSTPGFLFIFLVFSVCSSIIILLCACWDPSDFSSPFLLIEAGVGDAFSTLEFAHFCY